MAPAIVASHIRTFAGAEPVSGLPAGRRREATPRLLRLRDSETISRANSDTAGDRQGKTMHRALPSFLTLALVAAMVLPASSADTDAAQPSIAPSETVTGVPQPGGKGPGMGRAYRQSTPGPGRGGPDYRGGYSTDGSPLAEEANRSPDPDGNRETVPSAQGAGGPRRARDGRGQGYGYPGYRGQGGAGYPQHRQYGSPPPYPAAKTPGQQAAPRP